jgi:hypothetical protein
MFRDFIKNNFLSLIIIILGFIILLQRCSVPVNPSEPQIIRDTVWVVKDSVINSKPKVINTISYSSHDTIYNHYVPDTNYSKLVLQYQSVVNELLAKNIQLDSLKIDSIGYVRVVDTVQKNLITGRSYKYNLKYPIVKETIIQPAPKVRQLYVGGEFRGSRSTLINGVSAGMLYKNKKDQIFGVNLGLSVQGDPVIGVSSYWKISLKKNN